MRVHTLFDAGLGCESFDRVPNVGGIDGSAPRSQASTGGTLEEHWNRSGRRELVSFIR